MTTTTDLLTEYNQLDARFQELRKELHAGGGDEILDEMNRNQHRRKELALLIFGGSTNQEKGNEK